MPPGSSWASKHGDAVPAAQQVVRGGQAGRPGADDRHALAGRRVLARDVARRGRQVAVRREAVEAADRERRVGVAAVAALLAQPRADAAQRGRQRQEVGGDLGRPPDRSPADTSREEPRDVEAAPGSRSCTGRRSRPRGRTAAARAPSCATPALVACRCAPPCPRRPAWRTTATAWPCPRSAPRTGSTTPTAGKPSTWHRVGMRMPSARAASRIVVPASTDTGRPSMVSVTIVRLTRPRWRAPGTP